MSVGSSPKTSQDSRPLSPQEREAIYQSSLNSIAGTLGLNKTQAPATTQQGAYTPPVYRSDESGATTGEVMIPGYSQPNTTTQPPPAYDWAGYLNSLQYKSPSYIQPQDPSTAMSQIQSFMPRLTMRRR